MIGSGNCTIIRKSDPGEFSGDQYTGTAIASFADTVNPRRLYKFAILGRTAALVCRTVLWTSNDRVVPTVGATCCPNPGLLLTLAFMKIRPTPQTARARQDGIWSLIPVGDKIGSSLNMCGYHKCSGDWPRLRIRCRHRDARGRRCFNRLSWC